MAEAFEPGPASTFLSPLSALEPSLNIMSQFLFLHESPLVPLMVPHLGHLRTPRRVALPNPDSNNCAFAEVDVDMMECLRRRVHYILIKRRHRIKCQEFS